VTRIQQIGLALLAIIFAGYVLLQVH